MLTKERDCLELRFKEAAGEADSRRLSSGVLAVLDVVRVSLCLTSLFAFGLDPLWFLCERLLLSSLTIPQADKLHDSALCQLEALTILFRNHNLALLRNPNRVPHWTWARIFVEGLSPDAIQRACDRAHEAAQAPASQGPRVAIEHGPLPEQSVPVPHAVMSTTSPSRSHVAAPFLHTATPTAQKPTPVVLPSNPATGPSVQTGPALFASPPQMPLPAAAPTRATLNAALNRAGPTMATAAPSQPHLLAMFPSLLPRVATLDANQTSSNAL
jgi:hypothetical protein